MQFLHRPSTILGRENTVWSDALLSLTVFLGLAVVAWSDHAVETISLGYLYLLPLALSALVHPLPVSLGLALLCVALHDWFGPFGHGEWHHYVWSIAAGAGFVTEVLVVTWLGKQREAMAETIRRQRDDLARDIRLARDVQQRLLPQGYPSLRGFDVAARMFPAQLVSGDFFDYFPLPDGSFLFVVGDVSGKGVAAGVLTSGVTAALRAEALHELSLEQILERLNRVLCDVTGASRFVTLICVKLQPSSRRLDFARAGHPPGLVYRPSIEEAVWLDAGGPVLGVLPEASYVSSTLLLQEGDVVVLYTDGVSEAENGSDEPYPPERLSALLRQEAPGSATEILESIRASVVEFTHGRGWADDATLVVLKASDSPGAPASKVSS